MTLDQLRGSVGKELGVSPWHEITQSQIDQFAEVSGDRQWIHVDPERARRESPYGTTIAHGFLTVSMLSMFINEAIAIEGDAKLRVNYGFNRLRFTGAVPAGVRPSPVLTQPAGKLADFDGYSTALCQVLDRIAVALSVGGHRELGGVCTKTGGDCCSNVLCTLG